MSHWRSSPGSEWGGIQNIFIMYWYIYIYIHDYTILYVWLYIYIYIHMIIHIHIYNITRSDDLVTEIWWFPVADHKKIIKTSTFWALELVAFGWLRGITCFKKHSQVGRNQTTKVEFCSWNRWFKPTNIWRGSKFQASRPCNGYVP